MADIGKIIDNLNIPKQIIDKSEAILKTLFGPSLDELGGMIADNVKLRRFKNQIKIFSKAQKILKDENIDPQKVSLKVLAPLIDYSSYEEDPALQKKWANLTAFVLSENQEESLQHNFIRILNLLSPIEAKILDSLFKEFEAMKNRALQEKLEGARKRKSETGTTYQI